MSTKPALKNNSEVIDFFTNRDDWESQNPTYFYDSSNEYPIGIIGLNLIYFFINKLKLQKKLVSDSHLSIREWKLYKSLNVPVNRLEQEAQYSLGRTTEITRDEVKFKKFVDRCRKRFSDLFMQLLKTQLLLKGVITKEDWSTWKESITFSYIEDNYFSELKKQDMLRERFSMLSDMSDYVGKYVSQAWITKNILRFSDEEMKEIEKQIDSEKAAGLYGQEDDGF